MNSRRNSGKSGRSSSFKRDSRDAAKAEKPEEDFHPTLLRKAEPVKQEEVKVEVKKPPVEVPIMKASLPIISRGKIDSQTISMFVEPENSNFYVVGVVGMKDSGKTTVMNLIATGSKSVKLDENGNVIGGAPVFTGNTKLGIDAFITPSRVILLDSTPIMDFSRNRSFIIKEADDFRQIQMLLRLCNELIIVYEPHQVMNLIRMLICAKNLMEPYGCDEPNINLIENRGQPGCTKGLQEGFTSNFFRGQPGCTASPMGEIAAGIISKSHITDNIHCYRIPDIDGCMLHHEDPYREVERLRDDINTRKELKTYEEHQDSEKSWLEKLGKMKFNSEDLVQRYEGVCEKFYQQREY